MKMIIVLVVALSIATGLAYLVHEDPGYALLGYGNWSVETSFALLVFCILVLFVVLYLILRSLTGIRHMPSRLGQWNSRRKSQRSQKELVKGLIDSAEGNWRRSEKLLAKHANQSETPLLNYLSAAHAAQSQGAFERRDEYLLKAGAALPEQSHAIHLTRAKLQLSGGQFEEAVATLKQLQDKTPKHPVVLKLLMRAYQEMGDWIALRDLLPSLRRSNEIPESEWKPAEYQTYTSLLERIAQTNSSDALAAMWESVPASMRSESEYLTIYVEHMIRLGAGASTEQDLLKALKHDMDEDLLLLYSQIETDAESKIRNLETWSRKHPDNALISGVLGGLYAQQEQWDKAQTVLEFSISKKPTPDACFQLGTVYERQGDINKATSYYREGLALICHMAPKVTLDQEESTEQPA